MTDPPKPEPTMTASKLSPLGHSAGIDGLRADPHRSALLISSCEDARELCARAQPELGVGRAEVLLDRLGGEEELCCCLFVRGPAGDDESDLELLRCELRSVRVAALPNMLAGRAQLGSGQFGACAQKRLPGAVVPLECILEALLVRAVVGR